MKRILQTIALNHHLPDRIRVTLGFDGFIDSIVQLIRHHDASHQPVFFERMQDWGNYIIERTGKNFSVELRENVLKLGGNMPIMANALGRLGLHVHCVGALGYPDIDPIFKSLSPRCSLHSFARPGMTQAMEFSDGKIILGEMEDLNRTDWEVVKSRVGVQVLIDLIQSSALVGILNWGELQQSSGIWKGLLRDVLPRCTGEKKSFFIDLADCSKRMPQEIGEAMTMLREFSRFGRVMLGLNHNEAALIHQVLLGSAAGESNLRAIGEAIFPPLEIDTLVLHNRKEAIGIRKNTFSCKESFLVDNPKLLTGAGDNFNAGFCFGQLMGLDLDDSLLLAHAVSGYYIRHAESADWPALMKTLETNPSIT